MEKAANKKGGFLQSRGLSLFTGKTRCKYLHLNIIGVRRAEKVYFFMRRHCSSVYFFFYFCLRSSLFLLTSLPHSIPVDLYFASCQINFCWCHIFLFFIFVTLWSVNKVRSFFDAATTFLAHFCFNTQQLLLAGYHYIWHIRSKQRNHYEPSFNFAY